MQFLKECEESQSLRETEDYGSKQQNCNSRKEVAPVCSENWILNTFWTSLGSTVLLAKFLRSLRAPEQQSVRNNLYNYIADMTVDCC